MFTHLLQQIKSLTAHFNNISYNLPDPIWPPQGTGSAWRVMQTFKNHDTSLCNLCSFPLKLFNDEAETVSSLNVFHLLTILSEKKCLKSVITLSTCSQNLKLQSISMPKNLSQVTRTVLRQKADRRILNCVIGLSDSGTAEVRGKDR